MNDRLLMENYLLILKSTTEVFIHGTLESSNEQTREVLKKGLEQILSSQRETYNIMVSNGWYNISNIDNNTINQTLSKLQQPNN